MKKSILSILIMLSLVLSLAFLFSCEKENGKPDSSEKVTVKTIKDIGDYSIIRSNNASSEVTKAASALSADIYKKTGEKVVSVTDAKSEGKHEIIIGETARDIGFDYSSLGFGEFFIQLSGSKILILGGSDIATANAVNFFINNLVSEEGVRVPTGNGYRQDNEGVFDSLYIGTTSIKDYSIVANLFDMGVAEQFAVLIKAATNTILPIISSNEPENIGGKYIYIDDTNTDFSNYSINIKDGNIHFYANYTTVQSCIDYFFNEMLGYDIQSGKITGEKRAVISDNLTKAFLVDKKTPYTKDKLMSVLLDVYNDDSKLIIGQQMSERLGKTMETERQLYRKNCGVDAAMYGYDLGTMESNHASTPNARVKDAYDMIEYIREGGIITFSAHFKNPVKLPENEAAYRGELGHEKEWDELMTPGTQLNKKFMETLSNVTDFLEIFHKNDAPIIFRPLHEMNGNWFWFCIVNGENNHVLPKEYAQKLWKLIYDYVVTERGIDNLIWEYGPNVSNGKGTTQAVMYCYPGDEYCDIVAADWYTNEYTGNEMLSIAAEEMSGTGKIFSVSEFGPGEGIRTNFDVSPEYGFTCTHLDRIITETIDDGIKTAYWLLWSSWAEVRISMWNMGDARLFYDKDLYLTLEDMSAMLYN